MISSALSPKKSQQGAAPLRVALYARVSTEEQAEHGFSIKAQIEKLELACKLAGGTALPPYVDDGYSGKDLDRPHIKRLIQDARDGKVDLIIVYKLDRLSRRLSDLIALRDELEACKVGLTSATEPFDTTNPVGKLLFNMLGSFAQFERELIAERTRLGLRRRAKEGKWNSIAPFGYKLKTDGTLEIFPAEKPFVRKVFKLFLEHNLGSKLIARKMRREDHTSRRSGKWARTTVYKMLVNPVYAGLYEVDGEIKKAPHEAIITREEHEQVLARLAERGPEIARTNLSQNVLTGLIKCGLCGSAMTTGKGKGNYYYACNRTKNLDCPMEWVPAEPLEAAVIEDIRTMSRMPALIDRSLHELRVSRESEAASLFAERASLEKQLEKLERTKDEKVRWMLENLPTGPVAEELQRQLQAQLDSILAMKRRMTEVVSRIDTVGTDHVQAETVANCLKHFSELFGRMEIGQKRLLMQSLVTEVVVRSKDEINAVFALPLPPESQRPARSKKGGPLDEDRLDYSSWIPALAQGVVHRPAQSGVTEGT